MFPKRLLVWAGWEVEELAGANKLEAGLAPKSDDIANGRKDAMCMYKHTGLLFFASNHRPILKLNPVTKLRVLQDIVS